MMIPRKFERLVYGRQCSLVADMFLSLRIRREQRRVIQRLEEELR